MGQNHSQCRWHMDAPIACSACTPCRIACLKRDEHLNNIPLAKWDSKHDWVRGHVTGKVMAQSWNGQPLRPGTICWSLSESVCVLKAVAKAMAASADLADAKGGL